MMKRTLAAITLLGLTACDGANARDEAPTSAVTEAGGEAAPTVQEPVSTSDAALTAAINGDWRTDKDRARDGWRNPAETLAFFGVEPDDTVIEIWPGRGWYTNILAPYLNSGGGTLVAAVWDTENMPEGDRRARFEGAINTFQSYFASDPDTYGTLEYTALSDKSGPLGQPDSADIVLTFRNVHNWMANSYEAKVFEDAYSVLKPGGVLGVVEHRLPSSDIQDHWQNPVMFMKIMSKRWRRMRVSNLIWRQKSMQTQRTKPITRSESGHFRLPAEPQIGKVIRLRDSMQMPIRQLAKVTA